MLFYSAVLQRLEPGFYGIMKAMLKIAVVTDIHYGLADEGETAARLGLKMLEQSLESIHQDNFDLLVDLGDRLNDKKLSDARACLKELALSFRNIRMPRHHILGNNDILDVQKQEKILGTTLTNHGITMAGWHFIFLSAYDGSVAGNLDDFSLNWLERELQANDYPKIVFCHQPLDGEDLPDNRFFSDDSSGAYSGGAEIARSIMEESGKVKMVISGHIHQNKVCKINNINYVSITATTPFRDAEEKAAYAVLELTDDIRLRVIGRDELEMQFAL